MFNFLHSIAVTDADKQVYGSVIGSVLGALLGALAAFYVAGHARLKENEQQKIHENKKTIKEDRLACRLVNSYLMSLVIKNSANKHYTHDVGRGILDEESHRAVFQSNTPFRYDPAPDLINNILNEYILALWTSLLQEVYLQNNNIQSFDEYYRNIRLTIQGAIYTGAQDNLNLDAIRSDNETVINSMTQQQRANEAFRERCIRFIAHLRCYNKYNSRFDLKDSISLKEHRDSIEKLQNYEPSEQYLQKAIAEVEEVYREGGLFASETDSAEDVPQDDSPAF